LPSQLFKKAWKHANKHYDRIFILSAKYGLLNSETIIVPYNETLSNKNKLARLEWAKKVFDKLYFIIEQNDEIFIHAGVKYREFLEKWFENNGIIYHVPLRGLGIGQQLAWYSQQEKIQSSLSKANGG